MWITAVPNRQYDTEVKLQMVVGRTCYSWNANIQILSFTPLRIFDEHKIKRSYLANHNFTYKAWRNWVIIPISNIKKSYAKVINYLHIFAVFSPAGTSSASLERWFLRRSCFSVSPDACYSTTTPYTSSTWRVLQGALSYGKCYRRLALTGAVFSPIW